MIPMEETLLDLIARLARTSARSRVYAMRAKRDNRPDLARLFLALSSSQGMQAQRFLMQARGTIAATDENERAVFGGEIPGAIEEYNHLREQAEQEGFTALVTGFRHSAEVNRLFLELRERLAGQAAETDLYVCDFCGYIAADAPPDNCPVCTAPKTRFHKVEDG